MIFKGAHKADAGQFSRKRISRSLVTILAVTLLQAALPSQYPAAYAAAGNVGSSTSSGSCSSAVGETTYVEATFVNSAFCLIKFNTSTTWTVPSGVNSIDMLIVGGGGGGGPDGGGGGGGGQVREITGVAVTSGNTATVTVGTGGRGGSWTGAYGADPGVDSTVLLASTTYRSKGGGAALGATASNSPNYAAGGYSISGGSGGTVLGKSVTVADTSKGGRTAIQISGPSSQDATSIGYDGPTTSFTGTSMAFGGGGGGGIWSASRSAASFGGAAGGAGGGGAGATHTVNVGSSFGGNGVDGFGGGGGGGSASDGGTTNGVDMRTAGGRGGSGVAFIKYVPVISIGTNPSNATGEVGTTATFTAATLGTISGAIRSVKWQVLVPNGSWSDIPSSNSNTYTTPTITRSMHLNQYRFIATDTVGSISSSSTSSAATLSVTSPFLFGDTDTALLFNGTTQYLRAPDANSFDISDSITIEAWVYQTSSIPSNWNMVVNKENSYELGTVDGNWYYALNGANSWVGINTGIKSTLNTWQHVAITRAAGANVVKFYLNGSHVYTGTADGVGTGQIANSVHSLTVSGRDNGNNTIGAYFVGEIDELRIFASERTGSQISSDMSTYGPINSPSLRLYYDFNEGTGTTVYNRAAGALAESDLTIYNAPTWLDVKSSDTTTLSAYTILRFDRSYLTSSGGWKVPTNVTALSALIVAGGGGGGYNSGGGGSGGGVLYQPRISLSGFQTVIIGQGGLGATAAGGTPVSGFTSTLGPTTVAGGNPGGNYPASQAGGTGIATASNTSGAGGAGAANSTSSGTSGQAGVTSSISGSSQTYAGGGGGGGWAVSTNGGAGGTGGGGAGGVTNSQTGKNGTASTGGGGGAGSSTGSTGGTGGSGVIIVRWITASKPIFTQPTSDTTTAGLIDTITVSANPVSPLTRSYRWQSSSDTGTTWSDISTGSGFTSQTYSTPMLETNTSGIRYQYRVIVTDSDTAGLFISDTSSAVFITINPRISISGTYTTQKYGATHTDTFTAVSGTGTGNKTFTFTPNNRAGITWNGATINQATLTIARTLGPGTYYETMTATDTKGASSQYAIAIVVGKADTITVTSLARSDTYTGSALSFSPGYTITGLQNSDTVTSISWSYSGTENSSSAYGPSATKPINAGSYQITPSAVITNSDSYTAVVYETSTLTINRATRTITGSVSPSPLKFGATGSLSSTPSAGSGDGAVSYISSTTDSCTVSAANLQALKSSGTCSFTARIARGNNYESATSTSVSVSLIKADTLTVSVNAINPLTYTGFPANVSPTVTVSGLALTNAVGANPVTFTYQGLGTTGPTCAQGGTCVVGDTGPGGGKVFYVAPSQQSWGRYLEAAPANWSGGADNQASNVSKWCEATPSIDGTTLSGFYNGLGYGYSNTYDTRLNVCTGGAIYKTRTYRGGGFTNWYVPNNTELALMADSSIRTMIGLVHDSSLWGYWGSYQAPDTGYIGSLVTSSWGIGATIKGEAAKNMVRPIRAFSEGGVTITDFASPPTDAGTYTVKASGLTLSSGSLSDYQGVTYTDGTLLINRAQQLPLVIAQYGAIFGTPYNVMIFGGSGTGELIETVTAGTASGCILSGDTLTSTTVGTCQLTVTKARDRNYETATVTSMVYFLIYVVNQPVAPATSGPTIGLNGATSFETSTVQPPSITGLSTSTLSLGAGGTFTITGTGFTGSITVKFWRNKSISVTSSNGITIDIPVSSIASVGATSGRIAVITSAGEGISVGSLTITP